MAIIQTTKGEVMTEQEAKFKRKLKQAIDDSVKIMPEEYTLSQLEITVEELVYSVNIRDKKKLSTEIIAGLLRWQIDNL